jgi:hypothetical protein
MTPAWLTTMYCALHSERDAEEIVGAFMFHLRPEDFEVREDQRQRVRVTGRFDHPAAQTCQHHPLEDEEPLPPELVVLGCRSAFVVINIQRL